MAVPTPKPKPKPLDPATRAKKLVLARKVGSTTYDHRDPEKRRAYQRELMRKRREKEKVT